MNMRVPESASYLSVVICAVPSDIALVLTRRCLLK